MNTKQKEPEIIQGVIVEPPATATDAPMAQAQPPFVIQPQDGGQLLGLFIGFAVLEAIRWALWRGYDHLSDS